jgi:hypothetical protein
MCLAIAEYTSRIALGRSGLCFVQRVLDLMRSQATFVPSKFPCNVRSLLSCNGRFEEIIQQ